jgi:DNA-binding NarL/FixJ family response regulator
MTSAPRVLIVEDDASWQQILAELLGDMGLAVDLAGDAGAAATELRAAAHQLAVVDLSLGGVDHHNQDGLLVLDAIKRQDPGCISILLTGFATVELAVSALTIHGAYTCLRKETFRRAEFRALVREALAAAPAQIAAANSSHAGDAQQPKQEGPLAQGGHSILVVEDDAGWRSILDELLTGAGQRVRLSTSYGEALGLLRRQRFDLAIVDLVLASSVEPATNADGYHVLATTRAAAIPTIVVSGTVAPGDVERAYAEFNILSCLQKQAFDRHAFLRTVAEALEAHSQPDSLVTLTQRERAVLKLLAQGLTNKQIADALVISTNTVKRHLKAIFVKLGVSTRSAAAAKAVDAGVSQTS